MSRPPTTWHEFVGQRKAVLRIRRQLEGAQARAEAFPHLLLCGPSGMGKTRLAMAIAAEYRTNLHDLPSHLSVAETVEQLIEIQAFDIAFFDEAHNLKPPVQEVLFGVIDRLLIPNLNQEDDSNESNLQMLSIEPCTLIFATDQPGQLRNALLKRVPLHEQLAPYTESELREIVNRMARAQNVLVSPQAVRLLAKAAMGLPRKVMHLLQGLRNHFLQSETENISVTQVRSFLRAYEIDEQGFNATQRRFLQFLDNGTSASLDTLAAFLGLDPAFVKAQVEPALVSAKLITIGSNGRRLTEAGRKHLSLTSKLKKPEEDF